MRRASEALRFARLALELQLGRRLALYLAVDGAVLLWATFRGLLGEVSSGYARGLYPMVIVLPLLLLGIPALADVVALERRAGCLDLALSAPAGELYFLRRAGAVAVVLVAQGWLVMTLLWLVDGLSFALPMALLQVLAATLFVAAVTLFWAVRLRGVGGVWLASLATCVGFGVWLFHVPVPPRLFATGGAFLPGALEALEWSMSFGVLVSCGALFLLYARRRLRRPESMI